MFPPSRARLALAATALALLASCGAGIVAAVVGADDDSNNNSAARNPELTAPQPVGPLFQEFGATAFRRVIVSDVDLPPNFRVELRTSNATSVQNTAILSTPTPLTTVIGFIVQTGEIVLALEDQDPTRADVDAELAVIANGMDVAPPIPFRLLRQPTATLVPPGGPSENVFLSPLGGDPLVLRVSGLRADAKVEDLEMLIITRDPANPFDPDSPDPDEPRPLLVFVPCTNLAIERNATDVRVSGIAPNHSFPGEVGVLVSDSLAGSTPPLGGVFYGPDVPLVGATSPGAGPTDGGTLVSLFGTAMVPLNFDVPKGEAAVPNFDLVSVIFRKGTRSVTLRASDLRRADSSQNRLVFPMPPSPDGRPGLVGVVLRVTLGFQSNEAQGVFFYGDSILDFGPRGVRLNQAPVAVEMAEAEGRGTTPNPVLMNDVGGVPVLQLYGTSGNGMFYRLGLPVQAGDDDDLAQRVPVDLASGYFDPGPAEDLFVVNAGRGTLARHDLVASRGSVTPVLQAAGPVLDGNAQARVSVAGDLNGDVADDVVILPGLQAAIGAPEVFLAAPAGFGRPEFTSAGNPPVGNGPFQAISLDDLDGDQVLDVILASGGIAPKVVIAYGVGVDGQFEEVQSIDLAGSVPGYTADPRSGVVGVHACGDNPKSIAVVFEGVPGSGITEPTVAVLAPSGSRTHMPPVAPGVVVLGGADTPLGHSVAADLDDDGLSELILGASGDSSEPLRLLIWEAGTFAQKTDGVHAGLERPVHISSMNVDEIAPGAQRGLFVSHQVQIDGVDEQRLSTWLIAPAGPVLLAPDVSSALDLPIRSMVSGSFPTGQDLALASSGGPTGDEVLVLENDGLGTMSVARRTPAPGILPETLTLLALEPNVFSTDPHGLAYLRSSATLELLIPVPERNRTRQETHDLMPVLPPHLQGHAVSATSLLAAADVDGDGNEDVVALLRFDDLTGAGEGDGALVLLRGLAVGVASDPILAGPVTHTAAHGLASALAMGNLVPDTPGTRRLEVAVAVPRGDESNPFSGNHVRFYHYDTSTNALVRSFSSETRQALVAGQEPTQLALADFSGNGVDDILVAAGGDSSLRLFVNQGIHSGTEGKVNVNAFTPVAAPHILPPGEPTQMILRDLNGDRVTDVLVVTTQRSPALECSVAYYLRNALGSLDGPFLLPMSRTGNNVQVGGMAVPRNAKMALCATDFNGDGRVDLAFGWDSFGIDDRNLRVLFGGSR